MTQEQPGGEESARLPENFDTKQETNSNKAAGGNGAAADGAHHLGADGGMRGRRERESELWEHQHTPGSKSCSDYWTQITGLTALGRHHHPSIHPSLHPRQRGRGFILIRWVWLTRGSD